MSNYVFKSLSSVQSLLFSTNDHLDLGTTLENVGVSVTSSGLTTTLAMNGVSLVFPTVALENASQGGNLSFDDGGQLLLSHAQNTTMSGSGQSDAMYGNSGNDQLNGGSGNDYIAGGTGADTLTGGDGNDHVYGNGSTGGADGADMISGGSGSDYLQGNAGADTIDGGDGSDRILGGQDDDVITGGIGNDQINGNLGNDHIDGGAGEDLVRGGKGDDVVGGGDGADTVMGDLGADTLSGGSGADLFMVRGNDAAYVSTDLLTGHIDTITDFVTGEDHLSLGFIPHAVRDGSAGTLADALTWATDTLAGHGGDVATATVGNDTYLFYSSSGGAMVDSVIDLRDIHALSLGSFV